MIDTVLAEPAKKKRGRKPHFAKTPENHPQQVQFDNLEEENSPETPEAASEPSSDQEIPPFPAIDQNTTPKAIFDYWNNTLTKQQRQNGNVYVYRLLPVTNLEMVKGRLANPFIEKFSDEDGPLSVDEIYKRRRVGIYLLRLNQKVVKPHGTIAFGQLVIRGQGDWSEDEMPILDIEKVNIDHPENKEYVRVLRSRGILKRSEEEKGEEDEMVASQVLGDLASKAIDRMGSQPAPAAAAPAASDLAGVVGPIINLLEKQINQDRPASQQGTVLDMVTALSTLAKSNAPPAMDMAPFLALQKQNNDLVQQMMAKDVERAESDARRAREEAEQYKAMLPKPKSLREELREMRELQEEYTNAVKGKSLDDDGDEKEDAGPASAAGWLGTLLGALPSIERLWAHANNSLSLLKTGQPLTPPPAPIQAEAPEQPTVTEEANGALVSSEEQQRIDHMQNVINQLTALEQPMMKYFQEKKTGSEFAKFVVDNFGVAAVQTVASMGKQGLLDMLSQYPPVWSIVGPRIQDFAKFLDEFLAFQTTSVQ